jgi:hypothetical protein
MGVRVCSGRGMTAMGVMTGGFGSRPVMGMGILDRGFWRRPVVRMGVGRLSERDPRGRHDRQQEREAVHPSSPSSGRTVTTLNIPACM